MPALPCRPWNASFREAMPLGSFVFTEEEEEEEEGTHRSPPLQSRNIRRP